MLNWINYDKNVIGYGNSVSAMNAKCVEAKQNQRQTTTINKPVTNTFHHKSVDKKMNFKWHGQIGCKQ